MRRTSKVNADSPLMAPPITSSPSPFSTGLDSPVSIAWLTVVRPSTMTPSVGTFSPGLTSTRSPAARSLTATSSVEPSARTRWASDGISRTSSSSAREAPITDFISIQCPSSMMSIRVTSSQKNTCPGTPKTTAEL